MNKLLGISLAIIMVSGATPFGFSEPLQVQLEQEETPSCESPTAWNKESQGCDFLPLKTQLEHGLNPLGCANPNHVLVERNNGKLACVTEKTSEKLGWAIMNVNSDREISASNLEISDEKLTINGAKIDTLTNELGLLGYLFPIQSLTFPSQVLIDDSFDVTLNYAFLTPTIDDDEFGVEFEVYEEPLLQCSQEICESDRVGINTSYNVELLNRPTLVEYDTALSEDYIYPIPPSIGGFLTLPFNNTLPQQETFSFVIHQNQTDYNYGSFQVDFNNKDNLRVYFEILPNGIVNLSDQELDPHPEHLQMQIRDLNAAREQSLQFEFNNQSPESSSQSQTVELQYMPRELWDDFAQWLRDVKTTNNITDYREYLLANMSDSFVNDFLNEYPDLETSLETQSILSTPLWILPHAYGQLPFSAYVYGNVYFYDLDNTRRALELTTVCAYDQNYNPVMNGATHICGKTGSTGLVGLQSVPGNTNLFLGVATQSDNAEVYADNTRINYIDYSTSGTLITSSLQRFDPHTVSTTAPEGLAFKLMGELNEIRDWHVSELSYYPEKIFAYWNSAICYDGAGASPDYIDIGHDEMYINNRVFDCPNNVVSPISNPDTMAHEYAHIQFMKHYDDQSSTLPDDTLNGYHSPVHPGHSGGLAWLEGWAFFMATAYSESPTYQPSYMAGQWNFETRTHNEVTNPEFTGRPFVDGVTGEGNIAAILYDAFDSTNESGDDMSNQLVRIWNTMTDDLEVETGETIIAPDMQEFKHDWDDNTGYPSLDSIFTLNTIIPEVSCTPEVSNGFVFYDHFTCDLANWTQSGGNEMWEVKVPDERQRPNFPTDNNVANAANCDTDCNLTMTNPISLSGKSSASIEFWRYIDTSVDGDEGLRLEVSTDDTTWTELGRWTHNNGAENDAWTEETVSLNGYLQNNVKLRFVALASSSFEEVEIDDILIRASTSGGGGGCTPNCPVDPNGDDDGDGIANSVDTGVNTFSDSGTVAGGTTSGEITARGGQTFVIRDASDSSNGVTISTQSTNGDNTISSITVCNAKATLTMNNGDSVIATCGSVILDGTGNSLGVVYSADNGKTFSTRITNNDEITFDETIPTLSTTSSSSTLTITINGQVYSLSPGSTFTIPSIITGLATQQSNDSVILSWSAPSNGGIPITDYLVQYKKSSDTNWTTFNDGVSSTTGATVTGLEITSYDFKVASENPMGTADYSNPTTITLLSLGNQIDLDFVNDEFIVNYDFPNSENCVTRTGAFGEPLTLTLDNTVFFPQNSTIAGGTILYDYFYANATDGNQFNEPVETISCSGTLTMPSSLFYGDPLFRLYTTFYELDQPDIWDPFNKNEITQVFMEYTTSTWEALYGSDPNNRPYQGGCMREMNLSVDNSTVVQTIRISNYPAVCEVVSVSERAPIFELGPQPESATVTLELHAITYGATTPVTFDFEIIDNATNNIIETKQVISENDANYPNHYFGTSGSFDLAVVPNNTYSISELVSGDYKIWVYYGSELISCSVNDSPQEYGSTFTGNDGDTIVCQFIAVPFDY